MLSYLALLLYHASSSVSLVKKVNLEVGSNCGSAAIYQVTSFVVTPWPIDPNEVGEIIMTGIFHQAVHVDDIFYATTYNSQSTTALTIAVQESFAVNATKTFEFTSQFSNEAGSYVGKVQLLTSQLISCWQFEYTLD
ncbi:hypothetical protein SteCoe_5996 [Stentor coeruleus]|uniref:Reelin domain-containing protein n=1 Tax=Stentor coeruleus TaxID=5963 RepID=A0A1R2CQZ5_9CILI|nr:hypothetical protein SteCoe_5996 [Stentor coeruleus]